MTDLDGKVALITGASRGIGAAIATEFAAHGARVVLSARKREALEATAEGIDGDTLVIPAHAGDPDAITACVETAVEHFGGVDILVNNAAASPHYGRLIDIDMPRYDKIFQVNLRGPLLWIQECWRRSMGTHGGTVINMASIGGLLSGGPIGAYDVAKAALIHLTKHLATELAPRVRVNAIAPGVVKTDFSRALWDGDTALPRPPMQRWGEPTDVAAAAVFLATEQSSWITGQVLTVDGGHILTP